MQSEELTPFRTNNYSVTLLNQYTNRTVAGAVDVMGAALATNAVTVNGQTAYRKGEYYRKELAVVNTSAAVWQSVTNTSGGSNIIGNVFVPKTAEVFAHDADGNLTQDGRWSYTWDAENRLVGMESDAGAPTGSKISMGFEYDAQGRRLQKLVSTNNGTSYVGQYTNAFVYDGWNLVAELGPSQSALRTFCWGLDLSGTMQGAGGVGGLLWMNDASSSSTHFVAYDGNGNVAALVTAADGIPSANYEYGPFGEVLRESGTLAKGNPFRFSTKYQDNESDQLYYGYRFYNPTVGRWLSRDPIVELGFGLQHHNTPRSGNDLTSYVLAHNNPISIYDLLGLCTPGCNRAVAVARVVPDGSSPDLNEILPELVQLASVTEKFGMLFESGTLGASALIEKAATVMAASVSDAAVYLTTPTGDSLAEAAQHLVKTVGEQHGWQAYYRTVYQTCKCRGFLGEAWWFVTLSSDDVGGKWANLASSPNWKAATEEGDFCLNHFDDAKDAYKAAMKSGEKALERFKEWNKICD